MTRKLRERLTFANVVSVTALFVALGGSAIAGGALDGPAPEINSVASLDIQDKQVRSPDIATGHVKGVDVEDEGLTGADIADQSGVDTCVATTRRGQLCVRGENFARPFYEAAAHCGNLDLRLPSLGEALALARSHDIPNVDATELFWTDGIYTYGGTEGRASLVDDNGLISSGRIDGAGPLPTYETVCVTTPTN